jgi:hypothetical protein
MNQFNLNTVTILNEINKSGGIIKCKVIGKYIGGKRWKRGTVYLTQGELREIKLRELLNKLK